MTVAEKMERCEAGIVNGFKGKARNRESRKTSPRRNSLSQAQFASNSPYGPENQPIRNQEMINSAD